MAYSPIRSDATPFATQLVARWVLALLPAVLGDKLIAMCDSILCSVGYQDFNEATALAAANNASATFFGTVGDGTTTGYPLYTFNAPIAKTYLVRVHVCFFCSVFAAGDFVGWELKNNTTGVVAPNATAAIFPTAANQRVTATFDFPVVMQAGNNVLQMQWRSGTVGTTANVNTGDYRRFTVMG